jgi:hypothetical protein
MKLGRQYQRVEEEYLFLEAITRVIDVIGAHCANPLFIQVHCFMLAAIPELLPNKV